MEFVAVAALTLLLLALIAAALFVFRAASLAADLARLTERERNLVDEVARLRTAQETATREATELQRSNLDTNVKLAGSQKAEQDLQDRISRAENHIRDRDGKILDLGELIKELQSTNSLKDQDRAGLTAQLAGASQQIATLQGEVGKINQLLATANTARDGLQNTFSEVSQKLAATQQAEKELRERVARAETYITDRDEKIRGLELLLKQAQEKLALREAELAAGSERMAGLERTLTVKEQELAGLQEKLKTEFENIANNILKANASELSQTSQTQIAAILDPLRERIKEFEGKVDATYDSEKRDVLSLKEQIRLMAESSQNLGSKADGLAKALKGDVQMLGRWGELILERILSAAGLEEGREYITQGRTLGLRNEDGGVQKPDVIIQLPEKRTMVIDSKVSLANYDQLIAASDELDRHDLSRQFVRDVKAHIDGLAQKRYQDNDQISAHDCVLMFVAVEGALAAALTAEPDLFTYAWEKRVVLVGPPTLLMTLRTVASTWRYERQNQSARAIADQAAKLYDKLFGFVDDLKDVGTAIRRASDLHEEATKKLATGHGNALRTAQKLLSFGVHPKKKLQFVIVQGEKQPIGDDYDEEERDTESADESSVPT